MKRFYPAIITFLILALPIQARKSWEVREKGISAASVEKILADTENWKQTIKDGVEDTRATNLNAFTGEVKAQGEILPEFSELYFANVQANTFEVRWQEGNAYFRMNKDVQTFTIKKLVAGQTITIITKSANSTDPRGIECKSGHCTRTAGAEKMTGAEGDNINVFQVNADITDSVDVAFGPNVGGLLIYSVIVDEGDEEFDFSESKVAYLYDASTQDIDSDPFFNYTKIAEVASESIDIKDFSSVDTDTLSALENYDLVVLSYGLKADHPFVAMLKKQVNRVPILNLNASLNDAWGWASLENPSNAAGATLQTNANVAWNARISGGRLIKTGNHTLSLSAANTNTELLLKAGTVQLSTEQAQPGRKVIFEGGTLKAFDSSGSYSSASYPLVVKSGKK
jgi:hypothetical protein